FFFFQAEDGIRDKLVTGVQTCALPIYPPRSRRRTAARRRRRSDGAPRDRWRATLRRPRVLLRSAEREPDARLGAADRRRSGTAQADRSPVARAVRPVGRSRRAAQHLRTAAGDRAGSRIASRSNREERGRLFAGAD